MTGTFVFSVQHRFQLRIGGPVSVKQFRNAFLPELNVSKNHGIGSKVHTASIRFGNFTMNILQQSAPAQGEFTEAPIPDRSYDECFRQVGDDFQTDSVKADGIGVTIMIEFGTGKRSCNDLFQRFQGDTSSEVPD